VGALRLSQTPGNVPRGGISPLRMPGAIIPFSLDMDTVGSEPVTIPPAPLQSSFGHNSISIGGGSHA
jgi:hypothetical protein